MISRRYYFFRKQHILGWQKLFTKVPLKYQKVEADGTRIEQFLGGDFANFFSYELITEKLREHFEKNCSSFLRYIASLKCSRIT